MPLAIVSRSEAQRCFSKTKVVVFSLDCCDDHPPNAPYRAVSTEVTLSRAPYRRHRVPAAVLLWRLVSFEYSCHVMKLLASHIVVAFAVSEMLYQPWLWMHWIELYHRHQLHHAWWAFYYSNWCSSWCESCDSRSSHAGFRLLTLFASEQVQSNRRQYWERSTWNFQLNGRNKVVVSSW